MPAKLKNAPTCHRAPRWPDPEFPRKIPKKYPRAEILEPQENTAKIPTKNTENTHFRYFLGIFSVFSGYFGGKFWESRISGRGVFFRYFSWKFRVGPFRGSVAGRGVLNAKQPNKQCYGFDSKKKKKFSKQQLGRPPPPVWSSPGEVEKLTEGSARA